MSQHDYVLNDAAGASFRSDLNNALAAIVSQNSGATAPSPTFAYQFWADTTAGILKQRNAANSAWLDLFSLSTGRPSGVAASGANSDITSLTGLTTGISGLGLGDKIQPIDATVSGNALTLKLNPTTLDFRSSTLSSATVNTRVVSSQITMTVSSGSTLGTTDSAMARLVILAIDNGGTVELAVLNLAGVNFAGGAKLDETSLISTTAEGGAGAADSASTIYSTTARTNVPYRIVGFIDIAESTAGTWATDASVKQGIGGQAMAALSSLGYWQTWQDVTGSRALSTTYYNTKGKPIEVSILCSMSSANYTINLTVSGVVLRGSASGAAGHGSYISATIPNNASYSCGASAGSPSIITWLELR